MFTREHSISTAMGNGLALPHARIEGYADVLIAIGVTQEQISCELATKEPGWARLFFLIVTGKTKNQKMLQLMAALTQLAGNQLLLDEIFRAREPEQILTLIKETKITLKGTITAEDIMNPDIQPVNLTHTLEEVARRLVVENVMGLPVVSQDGQFLGEITERELIEFGMPKYASVMNDLSFMTTGELFEAYFTHESTVTVKELYRQHPITVDKRASIMEICFIMMNKGNTRLYVVEQGKYLGMIVRSDIIKKVLHI